MWSPQDDGVLRQEGCYLPEGLRARLVFPSSPSGRTGQDSGSQGGGALSHRRRASSAAQRGLPASRLLPGAAAVNTPAIIKQTLTWAGSC